MGLKEKIDLIIKNNKANELYLLLAGLSEYRNEDAEDVVGISDDTEKLFHLSMDHLRFIDYYGVQELLEVGIALRDVKYCPFPEEFDNWIERKCPGIAESEIDELIKGEGL